jgi:hypothetical protein
MIFGLWQDCLHRSFVSAGRSFRSESRGRSSSRRQNSSASSTEFAKAR